MKDWTEKILEGMKLIREGCKTSLGYCSKCPFDEYCNAIMFRDFESPDTEWEKIK